MTKYPLLFLILYIPLNVANEMIVSIDKYDMCDDKFYSVVVEINRTRKGDDDLYNIDIKTSIVLDDRYTAEFIFFVSRDGVNYIKVFSTKTKYCAALKMNLGDFFYKAMKDAGVPSKCPLQIGHYSLHEYRLDFKAMRLQNLPAGNMKVIVKLENNEKDLLHCSVAYTTIKYS